MAKHDHQQRRSKRLAKHKKRRANASRPSRDAANTQAAPPSTKGAKDWPIGDCLISEGFDEPSAELTAVVTRVHADGRAVAAFVDLDRGEAGIRSIKIKGFASLDHVYGECGSLSEQSDQQIVGAPAPLVVGLVVDAHEHGSQRPVGWDKLAELIDDVDPLEAKPPFGAPPPEPTNARGGLLDALFRWLG